MDKNWGENESPAKPEQGRHIIFRPQHFLLLLGLVFLLQVF